MRKLKTIYYLNFFSASSFSLSKIWNRPKPIYCTEKKPVTATCNLDMMNSCSSNEFNSTGLKAYYS
jgi:hypothetical protein